MEGLLLKKIKPASYPLPKDVKGIVGLFVTMQEFNNFLPEENFRVFKKFGLIFIRIITRLPNKDIRR